MYYAYIDVVRTHTHEHTSTPIYRPNRQRDKERETFIGRNFIVDVIDFVIMMFVD